MFSGCSSLRSLDVSAFETNKTQIMKEMFYGCSSLTSINLSNFDTGEVKEMNEMFSGCSSLIYLDISSFKYNYYSKIELFDGVYSSIGTIKINKSFKEKIADNIPTNWDITICE
jgi:surface protein